MRLITNRIVLYRHFGLGFSRLKIDLKTFFYFYYAHKDGSYMDVTIGSKFNYIEPFEIDTTY